MALWRLWEQWVSSRRPWGPRRIERYHRDLDFRRFIIAFARLPLDERDTAWEGELSKLRKEPSANFTEVKRALQDEERAVGQLHGGQVGKFREHLLFFFMGNSLSIAKNIKVWKSERYLRWMCNILYEASRRVPAWACACVGVRAGGRALGWACERVGVRVWARW